MRYTISLAVTSLLASGAYAEVPVVVTDIPPVHSLVAQVMGDLGTPELLLAPGADEHSFQLRPSQAAALNAAGVVFWIGPELTPWLERALEGVPETVGRVALLDAEGTVTRAFAKEEDHGEGHEAETGGEDSHGHAEEASHEAEAGHGDVAHDAEAHGDEAHGDEAHGDEAHDAEAHGEEAHGDEAHDGGAHDADAHGDEAHDAETDTHEEHADEHAHGLIDPHAWLSPTNATVWVGVIAAELSRLDPDNAATYAANAAAAADRIAAADATARATLAPVADKPFVVFHDAYGYFTESYGLTVAGALSDGDAAAPGAARLTAMQQMIAAGGAVCVFPEVQHDPALLAQISEGSAARTGGELDPVGASFEPGPGMYAALITGMAETIAACLNES